MFSGMGTGEIQGLNTGAGNTFRSSVSLVIYAFCEGSRLELALLGCDHACYDLLKSSGSPSFPRQSSLRLSPHPHASDPGDGIPCLGAGSSAVRFHHRMDQFETEHTSVASLCVLSHEGAHSVALPPDWFPRRNLPRVTVHPFLGNRHPNRYSCLKTVSCPQIG